MHERAGWRGRQHPGHDNLGVEDHPADDSVDFDIVDHFDGNADLDVVEYHHDGAGLPGLGARDR